MYLICVVNLIEFSHVESIHNMATKNLEVYEKQEINLSFKNPFPLVNLEMEDFRVFNSESKINFI